MKSHAPAALSSNAPSGVASALLLAAAGSLLTAGAAPAQVVYNEATVAAANAGDFSNTFAGRQSLLATASTTTQVNGVDNNSAVDPDYFSFALGAPNAGQAFSLVISATASSSQFAGAYAGSFTLLDDNQTQVATTPFSIGTASGTFSQTLTGFVPASGNLVFFANQSSGSTEGGSNDQYTTTLSIVPEPATTSLVALGAALAALAARRNRKQNDAAE